MQTLDTPAPISSVVDIPAGSSASSPPTSARRSFQGPRRQGGRGGEVTYGDGVVRVEVQEPKKRPPGHSRSVVVTVTLPAGSRIEAKASCGELRGVGGLGGIAFESAQATVGVDEVASARLALQDGDVTVGRLTGPAEISTLRGGLTITEAARGAGTLLTEQGDITARSL